MLLLLRNMLREVEQLSQEPGLPCQYFDLIAGSGTGGFIALLLGRLRLSMDKAIECYTRVVERVFMRTKAGGNFRVTPFEDVLKEIVNRFADGDNTQMIGERGPRCRTFVCVREDDDSGAIRSQKLRTYVHPAEPAYQCTFLEAVRATMGNPALFKPPTTLNDNGTITTFLDAGDAHYNPVYDLYDEAMSLFPSRNVAYLVSFGAGRANTVDLSPPRGILQQPRLPRICLSTMHHLADCCDTTAAAFLRDNAELERVYYRFTHDQGSVDGKMAKWEQVEALKEFLVPYALAVDDRSSELVEKMIDERESVLAAGRRTR
ncbi:acyl transferase/acyl hydrolase/lysophospholipase [Schizophyllum amplum]|uniref:Acyl transferase/acyl hydrolase/lysophospholipase n=1 Tax=Schizophyllum amplum TaxID=97359 RepID=A0A550C329_9AGAR|nr:acyl transferase/acyl hydrolase/lysophospholipase [Auriculariopsis ampla]